MTGKGSDDHTEDKSDRDPQKRNHYGWPDPEHHPTQYVPAFMVTAEKVRRIGRRQLRCAVCSEGVAGQEEKGKDRKKKDDTDKGGADDEKQAVRMISNDLGHGVPF